MSVSVDTTVRPATVVLAEPEDCARLHIAVTGGGEVAVREELASSDIGAPVDRDRAVAAVEAMRRWARGRVGDEWPEGSSSTPPRTPVERRQVRHTNERTYS